MNFSHILKTDGCKMSCISPSDFPMEAKQIFIPFLKTRVNNN